MAAAALTLFVLMMLLTGALRTLIQRRRTGDSGNRRTLSPSGSLGWSALTATDIGYLTVGVGGPLAHWLGLPPVSALQHPPVQVLGGGGHPGRLRGADGAWGLLADRGRRR